MNQAQSQLKNSRNHGTHFNELRKIDPKNKLISCVTEGRRLRKSREKLRTDHRKKDKENNEQTKNQIFFLVRFGKSS